MWIITTEQIRQKRLSYKIGMGRERGESCVFPWAVVVICQLPVKIYFIIFCLHHKFNTEEYVATISDSRLLCFFGRLSPAVSVPLRSTLRSSALPGNRLPRRGRDCGHMRAPVKSYVTVLAPLLARWLKRRRKEHGKTCERSEDFSERQLLFSYMFFDPVRAQTAVLCSKGITSERNVTALLQYTVFWGFDFLCSSG